MLPVLRAVLAVLRPVPPVLAVVLDLRAVLLDLRAVVPEPVLRAVVPVLRALLLLDVLRAAAARPAPELTLATALFSSCCTRRASDSISPRRPLTSSSTRRSSKLSRRRWAAEATSSSTPFPRARTGLEPSAVAWKVRSTALRTASTTSAPSLRSLLFLEAFLLSFFAMASQV